MSFCRRLLLWPTRRQATNFFNIAHRHAYHAHHIHNPRPRSLAPEKFEVPELILQMEDYSAQRRHDQRASEHFTFDTFESIWRLAIIRKRRMVLHYLANDAVHTFTGTHLDQARLIRIILHDVLDARLPPETIIHLLDRLAQLDQLEILSPRALQQIVLSFNNQPSEHDGRIIQLILPNLISHLEKHISPLGAAALSYRPRFLVKCSFHVIRRLVQLHDQEVALSVMQTLVNTRNIPSEVSTTVDASSKDFAFIIRSTLVKAAIHWDWRDVTGNLLKDIFQVDHLRPTTVSGVLDCIYGLLESPVSEDVTTCCYLLQALHLRAPDIPIPDSIVRQFYLAAQKFDMGDAAQTFFAFANQPKVVDRQLFPLPPGSALTWLLTHMSTRRHKDHLSRTLVNQVAEGEATIPLHDRARFIQLASLGSYGMASRTLYERYTIGRDRDVVRGDARVAVRLVSLFTKMIKQTKLKLQELEEQEEHQEEAVRDPQRQLLQQRITGLQRFVERVVVEFQKVHEPLERADHYTLTSMARCLIMLGQFNNAFDVLRLVITRQELPDVHDINVALTALAEYNPNTAIQLVEHMSAKGIRPSSVTFGTIVHHGILHGQPGVVRRAIDLAREHGETISNKAVVLLIRASVSEDVKTGNIKENLVRALKILQALTPQDLNTPDLSGKFLVYASLRAHEPAMAFKFWKLLIKDSAEWRDGEQRFIRRLIGRMIRKHVALEWVPAELGRSMLTQLGEVGFGLRRKVR